MSLAVELVLLFIRKVLVEKVKEWLGEISGLKLLESSKAKSSKVNSR